MKKIKIIFLIIFCLSFSNAFSQVEKFQAAYIINFTRFIEWPSDYLTGSFIIGIVGNDPVVKELEGTAAVKTIYGKKIEIKVFSNPDAITPVHILFVPQDQSGKISSVVSKIGNQNTLIISFSSSGIENGSGINFVLLENKLQFEIKKANITRNNLKINSELENLAQKRY